MQSCLIYILMSYGYIELQVLSCQLRFLGKTQDFSAKNNNRTFALFLLNLCPTDVDVIITELI